MLKGQLLNKPSHRKGVSLEEEHGKEKATIIKLKMSQARKNKTYKQIYGDNADLVLQKRRLQGLYNNGFKGKHFTEESRNKLSESIKMGFKNGRIAHNFRKKCSETRLKQMSVIMLKQWQNPEFRDKCVKATMVALKLRPTKPERIIASELGLFWKYVGDGQLIIGSKCPDFWNGDHKLIELFGDFWHRKHKPEDWINYYKKWGYDCLVIWEHELKNINNVKRKVKQFEELN
jgi:hypothetical protein